MMNEMMNEMENRILLFLESGYDIDTILKELNIDKISLADIIIELEGKELITLEGKNWILTQKGKDILKEVKEELHKKLKIEYLYGNISKDEFQRKRKELESVILIDKRDIEEKIEDEEDKEKKIHCPKCGKENKTGSKFCYKCGEPVNYRARQSA